MLRQLSGSGWSAVVTTRRTNCPTSGLLVEICSPVWCCSAHTYLIDRVLNEALHIVCGCLRPTPMDHLPILPDIQPVALRRLGATLSLAYRGSLDPDRMLHDFLSGSSDVR